ncbi:MAG: TolC family protein [Cystobacterineae bacterium]|nr:TolC family protein [Cystobacterineae bacterium]
MNAISLLVTLVFSQTPPAELPFEALPTLTFSQALAEAQQQNPDLSAARARLSQVATATSKARSAYLPQLKGQGGYTRNSKEYTLSMPTSYIVRDMGQETGPAFDSSRPEGMDNPPGLPTHFVAVGINPMEIPIQVKNQWGAQLSLTQGIILPEVFIAIRNASLAKESATWSVESARREILFGTARAYLGASALRESLDVQQAMLEVRRGFERDAQAQFEAGAVAEIVVLRAAQERANQEQYLERTRASYVSATSALAALLARPVDFKVQRPSEASDEDFAIFAADLTQAEEEALLNALGLRPEVAAARKNLEYVEGLKSGAIASYLPNIVASANFNTSNVTGFAGGKTTWNVGVGVSWNLLDGGMRGAQLRERSAAIAEARAQLRAVEEKVHDELRSARAELHASEVNLATAQKTAVLARKSAELVKHNFDAGVATYLEVTDANTALAGAELGVVTEALNVRLARLMLLKAMGQFGAAPPQLPHINP